MATQLENNTTTINNLITAINNLPDAITIDATLTQSGQAADAKETGDALLGKAPMYTYGTSDMIAGTSALETGKLYFVYE